MLLFFALSVGGQSSIVCNSSYRLEFTFVMANIDNLTDEQVDKVLEDCMNLENTFYKKGWDEGIMMVNEEAIESGEQYG